MLRDALFLARKDVQNMLRAKETILWVFVMPVVFFYFIGTVTGGFGGSGDGKETLAVQAPADAGFLATHLEERLAERNLFIVHPETPEAFEEYRRRLRLPEGFTASVQAGEPVEVRFDRREGGMGSDFDQIRIGRAVYTMLADLIVSGEEGASLTPEALEEIRDRPRALTLEVTSAGERIDPPSGFEQAIPGTMVMFTLLVLFTSGSIFLVIERKQGLLRRLASAPISRGSVVLGKWLGRMALGLVQVGFAILAGTLFFDMDWGSDLPAVLLVMCAYAGFAASLALLVGNLARSEGQAVAAGVIGTNVLAALGGCWWPIEITPAWTQKLALFLPTGLTMDALHKLISFGRGAGSVLPHVAILALAALLVGWLVARTFRFQ